MHEVSLVQNLIQTLAETYPNRMEQIRRVQLSAGLLSNVQPILMQNAFAAVIQEMPQYAQMELEVKVLPILIHCEQCNSTTEVQQYRFICSCGAPCNRIIQGEELMISQVEFETTTNPAAQ